VLVKEEPHSVVGCSGRFFMVLLIL